MTIKKIKTEKLIYFDLFRLLRGLESERPGIEDRVWKHMCSDDDDSFKPYNGRISYINLFYYGVGDEYELNYLKNYPSELEHCKKIHPEAFIEGNKEYELRKDFNLIQFVYQDELDNKYSKLGSSIEMFAVSVDW